jgi:hypothetical protein
MHGVCSEGQVALMVFKDICLTRNTRHKCTNECVGHQNWENMSNSTRWRVLVDYCICFSLLGRCSHHRGTVDKVQNLPHSVAEVDANAHVPDCSHYVCVPLITHRVNGSRREE